jgi:hypothetical protein
MTSSWRLLVFEFVLARIAIAAPWRLHASRALVSMRTLHDIERTPAEGAEQARREKKSHARRCRLPPVADGRACETVGFARVFTTSLHRRT